MLQVSVPIAYELLAQCLKQGQALVQRASLVGDFSDYESWKAARSQWVDPTMQALAHMYGGPTEAREFAENATSPEGSKRWQEQYGADLKCVKQSIDFLTVLQGELAFENGSGPPAAAELVSTGAALGAVEESPLESRDEPQERSPEYAPISEQEPFPERARETQLEQDGDRAHADAPSFAVPRPAESPSPTESPAPTESRAEEEPSEERAAVGAELAPAQHVGSQLAQHAQHAQPAEHEPRETPATARTREVYLAHGRDEGWKQAVEHLLEQAGEHEIKIVNRRASERARLTEELREDAPGSHYAVVLLTADDVGGARLESDAEPYFSTRAHQEVVFEMGFLVAALSPGRVCVLYEDGVEMPCDLDGVSHVRLDLAGTWQPKLLLHLRRAGFDYDMNKLAAA
jgi:predicted nucleotide-binding protein